MIIKFAVHFICSWDQRCTNTNHRVRCIWFELVLNNIYSMRGHPTTNYIQRTFRLVHFVVQWALADSRMIMKIIEQSVMPHVLLIVMKNYLLFTLVMCFIFADGYIIGQKIEKPQRTCAKNVIWLMLYENYWWPRSR